MADSTEWRGHVGKTWAEEWARTDRSFSGLTDVLLARASTRGFRRALDIGCGAGEVSLALGRSHPGSEIVGIDLSAEMIAAACARGAHRGNVSFAVADAARWRASGRAPDLLVSRHGVMFFTEPVAAFAHLAGEAAPGARLVFSCFRDIAENGWANRILSLLPNEAVVPTDPLTPGPFSMADRRQVSGILVAAGWTEIAFEPVDFAFILGAGDDPLEDALSYCLRIGPAARATRLLSDGDRARFIARLRRFLAHQIDGSIVALMAGAWIVTARAPL